MRSLIGTISRITDKILPIVKEGQEQFLEDIYTVVFMDAIHYHVRHEGRIVKRAVYIAMNGRKDMFGMYVGKIKEQSSGFLSSIGKKSGVQDILIAYVDDLVGLPQAIETVFPKTEIQQCIIHKMRNTTRFISYKEVKPLMADLKHVYATTTEEITLIELEKFEVKWGVKYPGIAKSWKDN